MATAGASDPPPAWRREPYRVLFPLGIVLAWAGLLPWLRFALDPGAVWPAVPHGVVQVQGTMTCFVLGFLATAIPRRTQSAPPGAFAMAVFVAGPVLAAWAAWTDLGVLAQAVWATVIATALGFALRRLRGRAVGRRPPDSFVWIPLALGIGLVGAALRAGESAFELAPEVRVFGRLLLQQGLLFGLVVGVGGMVLPLITRGEAVADGSTEQRRGRWLHAAAALALVATFAVEASGARPAAHAARAVLALALLAGAGGVARLPARPGAHRWLVWLSAWAIPLGYVLAAALPRTPQAGLHVVFVAGFGLMALAVATHVSWAHGGRQDLVVRSPVMVLVMGGLLLAAAAARLLVHLDGVRLRLWVGIAAGAFLLATLAWLELHSRSWPVRRPGVAD